MDVIKKIKDLTVISPLILGYVTILGFIKLNVYYGFFNIKITSYIDLSEIITYFMDDLWTIFIVILGVIIYFLLIFSVSSLIDKLRKKKLSSYDNNLKEINWVTILITLIVLSIPIGLFYFYHFLILLIPISIYLIQLILMFARKIKEEASFALTVIVVSLSLTICISWYNFNQTVLKGSKFESFVFENQRIDLSKKIVIGKTKNYFFVGDSTRIKIYQSESIKEIEMRY